MGIKVKAKPVFNFQSVEFDWDVNSEKDLDEMFVWYKKCLDKLVEVAPDQANRSERDSSKKSVDREPLATEKQREIMRIHGIKFTSSTTRSEATELINQSMNKSR